MLELHTELTLVPSPLAALHPSSWTSHTPRAEPRKQDPGLCLPGSAQITQTETTP